MKIRASTVATRTVRRMTGSLSEGYWRPPLLFGVGQILCVVAGIHPRLRLYMPAPVIVPPPSRFQQPAETLWWGLGRFVFAQRVSGFRAVGPGSVPAKCQIYPSRVRPRGVIEPIELEIRPAGQLEGPPGLESSTEMRARSRTTRTVIDMQQTPAPRARTRARVGPGPVTFRGQNLPSRFQ